MAALLTHSEISIMMVEYTTVKDENHNSINYDSEMTNRLKQQWKLSKNRRQQQDLDFLQTHE